MYDKFMEYVLKKKEKFHWRGKNWVRSLLQCYNPEEIASKIWRSWKFQYSSDKRGRVKALLDLGVSYNLMSLSIKKRIGDLKVWPIKITLELTKRSMKLAHGVAEDVLVRVEKFTFPFDFLVMEIEEDE